MPHERYEHLINQPNFEKMPEQFQKRFKVNHDLHLGNIPDSSYTISSSGIKKDIESKLDDYLLKKSINLAPALALVTKKSIEKSLDSYLNRKANLETQKITDTLVKVSLKAIYFIKDHKSKITNTSIGWSKFRENDETEGF